MFIENHIRIYRMSLPPIAIYYLVVSAPVVIVQAIVTLLRLIYGSTLIWGFVLYSACPAVHSSSLWNY